MWRSHWCAPLTFGEWLTFLVYSKITSKSKIPRIVDNDLVNLDEIVSFFFLRWLDFFFPRSCSVRRIDSFHFANGFSVDAYHLNTRTNNVYQCCVCRRHEVHWAKNFDNEKSFQSFHNFHLFILVILPFAFLFLLLRLFHSLRSFNQEKKVTQSHPTTTGWYEKEREIRITQRHNNNLMVERERRRSGEVNFIWYSNGKAKKKIDKKICRRGCAADGKNFSSIIKIRRAEEMTKKKEKYAKNENDIQNEAVRVSLSFASLDYIEPGWMSEQESTKKTAKTI